MVARYNVSFQNMNGESAKVVDVVVSAWVKQLGDMLKDYAFEDIYNADETGLFFKCRPSKTFNIIGEKCFNGERSKERLTILFAANMTGTDKLTPLVIGKSQNPRCFKGINKANEVLDDRVDFSRMAVKN